MIVLSDFWQETWKHFMHVGVAYLLTVTIGWDREQEGHSAGVRTFPIVGMASCGYLLLLGYQPDVNAQSRLLQGLITGIGFIGGGAILKDGSTVRGTATAASVWNAGVIGAAVAIVGQQLSVLLFFVIKLLLQREQSPQSKQIQNGQCDCNSEGTPTMVLPPADISGKNNF